ncbi:hypothetical protein L204_101962 [Cryptococcus depauperatus]
MALHQPLANALTSLASTAAPSNQLLATWHAYLADAGPVANNPDIIRSVLELAGKEVVISAIVEGKLVEPPKDSVAEEEEFQAALQGRLDIVLSLYEAVYADNDGGLAYAGLALTFVGSPALEPGALFLPLVEELVELLSVSTWRRLWTYIETRSKRFTKNMPASRGKALPLLRTINAFLRFLSRTPEDLVFRGRIHQFASSVFSVADKSAINMRGDYGEVKTVWEEEPEEMIVDDASEAERVEEQMEEGNEDAEMSEAEDKEKEKAEENEEYQENGIMEVKDEADTEGNVQEKEENGPFTPKAPKEPDLYSTLWSLQHYFAHPPSLDGPSFDIPPKTPFENFRSKTDFVLPKLFEQTRKEAVLLGKEERIGKKRKHENTQDHIGGFFYPRYLTGKRLFEYELADPSFRRQILVQYFILFQFLLNLTPAHAGKQAFTGGMPRSFVLAASDEVWVKTKIGIIKEELKKMVGGTSFEDAVFSIIRQEAHYASWKNEGCPEGAFEIAPLSLESAINATQAWSKRLNSPFPYPFKVGSRPLSMLWSNGFTSIDQLKGREKATSVETIYDEIKCIEEDEEDDKAMGQESIEKIAVYKERKTTLTWRALRLASQTSLRFFPALKEKRNVHLLLETMKKAQQPKVVRQEGEGGVTDSKVDGVETDEEDVQDLKILKKGDETPGERSIELDQNK